MKSLSISLCALALLAGLTLAAPDSLACRMIDWMDAPGSTMRYGSTGDGEYNYLGTCLWDMAMGDSLLVWLPGTDIYYLVNPFSQTEVETVNSFDYGSENVKGIAIKDSICFLTGGPGIVSKVFESDSLRRKDLLIQHFASFHYAVIRDTFLYTASTGSYGLHCINIANPESIFVVCTAPYFFGECGMEVIDSFVYIASFGCERVHPPDDSPRRPHRRFSIVKLIGDSSAVGESLLYNYNVGLGDIASDGEKLFEVYTDMSDWTWGTPYTLDDSHLKIWGTDYSYTWADYDSEGVIGIDILNEFVLAVGFEHGFSILNYANLDSIYEVAYYRDTDSIFAFTHFALKENRMFAMAHPRDSICRMYMFELDSAVISAISDPSPQTALPHTFAISAYPNPFNSAVTIAIDNPVGDGSPVPISVEIYDVNGRRVKTVTKPVEVTVGFAVSSDINAKHPSTSSGSVFFPLTKGGQGGSYIWRPDESLPSGVYLVRARFDKLSDRGGRGDLDPTGTVVTARVVYLK